MSDWDSELDEVGFEIATEEDIKEFDTAQAAQSSPPLQVRITGMFFYYNTHSLQPYSSIGQADLKKRGQKNVRFFAWELDSYF